MFYIVYSFCYNCSQLFAILYNLSQFFTVFECLFAIAGICSQFFCSYLFGVFYKFLQLCLAVPTLVVGLPWLRSASLAKLQEPTVVKYVLKFKVFLHDFQVVYIAYSFLQLFTIFHNLSQVFTVLYIFFAIVGVCLQFFSLFTFV